MDGARCKDSNVVYQANVFAPGKRKEGYVGMCHPPFKSRLGNHKSDFKHSGKRNHTRLAGYIWSLKDAGLEPRVEWQFLATSTIFKPSTKTCRLCTSEKFHIMHSKDSLSSLNKRSEFFSSCLHKEKLLV